MRPTWAEIDLDSLIHNFGVVKGLIGEGVGVLSVVKADAYGHGAVEVGRALEEAGTEMLGVATVEEAVELRDYGIDVPILLLGGMRPDEAPVAAEYSLTPCLFSLDVARSLEAESVKTGRKLPYHLKIDTGMTRLGVRSEELGKFLSALSEYRNIVMEGALTHLAQAFSESQEETRAQLGEFSGIVLRLREKGFTPRYVHVASSAAVQRYPESHFDLVRPGIMLYGSDGSSGLTLRPVMKLKSVVIQVRNVPAGTPVSYGGTFVTKRPSVIATLPIGYADGYMRRLSNRAKVSIRGALAPVAGTVCMDLIMIDATEVPGISVGDEVVLFGDALVSVDDIARWAETISYEVLSNTGKRVPRRYV